MLACLTPCSDQHAYARSLPNLANTPNMRGGLSITTPRGSPVSSGDTQVPGLVGLQIMHGHGCLLHPQHAPGCCYCIASTPPNEVSLCTQRRSCLHGLESAQSLLYRHWGSWGKYHRSNDPGTEKENWTSISMVPTHRKMIQTNTSKQEGSTGKSAVANR